MPASTDRPGGLDSAQADGGMGVEWMYAPAADVDIAAATAARARQDVLTKPRGALGRLEEVVVQLAGMQSRELPRVDRIHIAIFAADHGVADERVSAFPRSVTAAMLANFAGGGAAISVLARELGATLEVVDLGTAEDPGPIDGVRSQRIAAGTHNFCHGGAMSPQQLATALEAGRAAALRAVADGADVLVVGEMGIANTTAAAALGCVLLTERPERMAGPGTGLDAPGVRHKIRVIRRALALHAGADGPLDALCRVGGFEIAALAGAFAAAAQARMPAIVDGFPASVAALVAARTCAGADSWLMYGHRSAEPGHRRILGALNAHPLLDLGMRLGEGSGAAVAVPVLRSACALHAGMATFCEAGVVDGPGPEHDTAAVE